MSPENISKDTVTNKKRLIILAVISAVICVSILLAGYFIRQAIEEFSPEEMETVTDELMRTKHFISDWFDEISASRSEKPSVYLNELRFGNNEFTLTYASGRIRAVYPRGERFFKLDYVNKIEFFEVDEKVRCRLYYGKSGEYTFNVKN